MRQEPKPSLAIANRDRADDRLVVTDIEDPTGLLSRTLA
jgi:hypothetical protein